MRRHGADSGNVGQIHAGDPVEFRPEVECRFVTRLRVRSLFRPRGQLSGCMRGVRNIGHLPLNTVRDRLLVVLARLAFGLVWLATFAVGSIGGLVGAFGGMSVNKGTPRTATPCPRRGWSRG